MHDASPIRDGTGMSTEPQGRELPDFPVDDFTLNQLEHALNTCIEITDEGERRTVGGEFTVSQFLDFMSGYDPDRSTLVGYTTGIPGSPDSEGFHDQPIPIYEGWDQHYSDHCVIRALIAEVRRLRAGADR